MKRAKRQSAGTRSKSDRVAAPSISKEPTDTEVRAAEIAVQEGTAAPEQKALVAFLESLADQVRPFLRDAPKFVQADSHARGILARMKSDGMQDFWEYIAANPPNGLTVLALVRLATDKDSAAAKRLLDGARREQTSNARKVRAKNAVMRDGRDWRETAREIAKGTDPITGKPWRRERLLEHLQGKFHKVRRTVERALNPKN